MKLHRSKFDAWLLAILGFATVMAAIAMIGVLIAEPLPSSLVALAPLAVIGLAWWLVVTIRYEIAPPELIIRAGFFRWRVPLAGIRQIRKTMNPLSSPAGSLDRLRIDYEANGRKKWIMISPRDKAAFIADLRAAGANFESPEF